MQVEIREAGDIGATVAGLTASSLLARQVRSRPDDASIHWRRDGAWHAWTWREYGDQVARAAGGLRRLGFGRGDRLVLMTHPQPEFHVADSAALLLGGCPIAIYTSSPPARVRYLVDHCRASVVIVEDHRLLAPVLAVRDELPALRHVVVVDPGEGELPPGVLRWDDLLAAEPVDLDGCAAATRPDDLCTVVYTSGTTGVPKGVMLDHAAVLWTCESYVRRYPDGLTGARWISYLPVAHIATRLYAQYLHVYAGLEDVTCPNPADVGSVLVDRPPQLFFAPPRLWETYLASLRQWIDTLDDPGRRAHLTRALQVSQEAALVELGGSTVPPALAREHAELRPAYDELRAHLGLDRLISGATGAAPTTPELIAAWTGLGVPMFEGYGLSESTGMLTVDPFGYRFGTVGRPLPGVELRLADDGELLFRSGGAFRGYLDDPGRTAEVVDAEGWVSTGDLATIDDGYVVLQGRKKELIVTAGGENVAPVAVELALLAMPLIGQACVVGEGRPALGALVLLDAHAAAAWASDHGIEPDDPAVLAEVGRQIAAANETLVRQEKARWFRVLPGEWLPDSDELTPTAKLRRADVATKYAREIEAMFADPPTVPVL